MRARWAVVAGLALALVGGPAGAASGVKIEAVDASDPPRLSVTVSLSAAALSQRPSADDFAVLIDGVRPRLDVFALIGDPIEVVVAIDTSGSMRGSAMVQARQAAIAFVEEMPDSVQVAVVGFGTEPEVVAPFGTPVEEIVSRLGSLEASGNTALYDAVVVSAAQFANIDVRRVVLVLSDGGDTSSQASIDEATAVLAEGDIELRAVSLITSDTDTAALERLSTGAPVVTVHDASELIDTYRALASELTGRFRLSFTSSAVGPTQLQVFVNTAGGVVTDAVVVDLPAPGTADPAGPISPVEVSRVPVAVPDPVAYPVTSDPGLLGRDWGLPVGVALVFLGLGAAFWMAGRNGEEGEVALPLDGLGLEAADEARGLMARLRRKAGAIGDRVGGSRMRAGGLDQKLDRAGVALRPGEFVILAATLVIVAVTAGLVLAGTPGAVALGLAVPPLAAQIQDYATVVPASARCHW